MNYSLEQLKSMLAKSMDQVGKKDRVDAIWKKIQELYPEEQNQATTPEVMPSLQALLEKSTNMNKQSDK